MKRFVVGDVHGALRALKQCVERAKVNKDKDEVIFLGDVCDGWPETKECVDYILTFKHYEYIIGNHDEWTLNWMKYGVAPTLWTSQGGEATLESYRKNGVPESHIKFFEKANLYLHYDDDLFVHGGIYKGSIAEDNRKQDLLWDRSLANYSKDCVKFKDSNIAKPYKRIFIGHTTTSIYGTDKPIIGGHIYNLDTGAGWEGKLTIMDLDTEEYWQSDVVANLYPECKGRR